jgi:DNA-binding MarR family transcriptional regulator
MAEVPVPARGTAVPEMPPGAATRAIRHLLQLGDGVRHFYAKGLGLGRSDYVALAHIYCEGSIQPRDLGARLGMGSGTLTPLLDRLERRGYAMRTDHPLDRRRLLIVMTPAGQAAMDEAFADFDAVVSRALEEIGSTMGLSGFTAIVDRLSDAIAARMEPPPTPAEDPSPDMRPSTGPLPRGRPAG